MEYPIEQSEFNKEFKSSGEPRILEIQHGYGFLNEKEQLYPKKGG